MLRPTREAMVDPTWGASLAPAPSRGEGRAPRLAGATLVVDGRRVRDWVVRLLGAAGLGARGLSPEGALDLVRASLNEDRDVSALAGALGVDGARLAAVAPLAAVPLLHAARRAAGGGPRVHGPGYCPTCGAWPTLAELRGLERARHLRCARCGDGWELDWLRCPFCGEREHVRLGWLAPEATRETRRVETCASCRGYVKTVARLTPTPPEDLVLADLETVDLDVAALQAGHARPAGPGHALDARLTAAPARRRLFGR